MSMWEGWPQSTSSATAPDEQQLVHDSVKSPVPSFEQDLSPWLMSGSFQFASPQPYVHKNHDGGDTGGGESDSGPTEIYPDEFNRLNICSSTSSATHGIAAADHASEQLYIQPCRSAQTSAEQSVHHYLTSTPGQTIQDLGSLKDISNTLINQLQMRQIMQENMLSVSTDLNSRPCSPGPDAGPSSHTYTQMIQHLVGQYDGSSSSTDDGYGHSSQEPSDRAIQATTAAAPDLHGAQQQESGKPNNPNCNTACDDETVVTLKHHHRSSGSTSKNESGDIDFSNQASTDLDEQLYAELHGLLVRNLHTPTPSSSSFSAAVPSVQHDPQEREHSDICRRSDRVNPGADRAVNASYGVHSGWMQFSDVDDPSRSTAAAARSSHAGDRTPCSDFNLQSEVDWSMIFTPDALPAAKSKSSTSEDLSPSSTGTTIQSLGNAIGAAPPAHGRAYNPHAYDSGSTDLDSCPDVQRKRILSQEQEGDSSDHRAAQESLKRSCIDHHRSSLWQNLQSQALFGRTIGGNYLLGSSLSTSHHSGRMDMCTAVGPALNTNGRPRARRGSATDPQSVYARHRRERINDRLKVLQHLVPNGAKVDIVTMLEEAINYVKFLQEQVRLLNSDDLWVEAIHATYNGVDVSMGLHAGY